MRPVRAIYIGRRLLERLRGRHLHWGGENQLAMPILSIKHASVDGTGRVGLLIGSSHT